MINNEENLKVAILERQILHCLFDHNELLDKEEIDFFTSAQAQEFYFDMLNLKSKNKKIIAENIITLDNEYVNSDLILAVQDTDYDIDEFETYKNKLRQKSIIHELRYNILDELNESKDDYDKLDSVIGLIEDAKKKNTDNKTNYYTTHELIEEYKVEIGKRSKGIKNTTGDYNLDKLISNAQAGIGLIIGMSGSMKSTFIIKLLRNRITKRLPTCAINTELTHATYMDTLVSTMIDESYTDLLGNKEDDFVDWDTIISKLDELEKRYDRINKKFAFYPENAVSIKKIENFCLQCRKDFNLKKDELLFCTIDLLLMLEDMNVSGLSREDAITQGLNKLNEVALKHNIFFLGTIQSRRKKDTIKIEKIEDLVKYKIALEEIKSAGSLEERSRVIIALHNPHYLANRNPTTPQIVKDLVDPILELTVLKNSWEDNLGKTIYYYIDNEHKDLIDYEPENGEIPNSGFGNNSDEENDNDVVSRLEKELKDD